MLIFGRKAPTSVLKAFIKEIVVDYFQCPKLALINCNINLL